MVFDNQKRPALLVGESLVAAAVPYLQRLGIEDEVAAVSAKKYGAALRHPSGLRVDFKFRRFSKSIPDSPYNIPRPEFDLILFRRAKSLGVCFVTTFAKVEKGGF
jgi:2-polyprenyl-6-methoxyphenol hydroxylase-like FAD-dependent oxidoreductase